MSDILPTRLPVDTPQSYLTLSAGPCNHPDDVVSATRRGINEERFWSKVDTSAGLFECWAWQGSLDKRGYGRYSGRLAHRVAYELLVGPIPEGLTIDHLCYSPACVNTVHMEVVTLLVNMQRQWRAVKPTCKAGHPFDEANTYRRLGRGGGKRGCRACNLEAVRRYNARRRKVA